MVSLPLVEVGVNCLSMGGVGEGVEGKLTIWTPLKGLCPDRALWGNLSIKVGVGDCDSLNILLGFVLASCFSVKFTWLEDMW